MFGTNRALSPPSPSQVHTHKHISLFIFFYIELPFNLIKSCVDLTVVKNIQDPVKKVLPPPLVAMPPARGLKPKFPAAAVPGRTTRPVDTPPREKYQEKTRSVECPPLKRVEKLGVGRKAVPPSGKIGTPSLKMFSLLDLKTATKNFRPESMIGEGGFGQVFKGWLEEKTLAPSRAGVGIPVAVKKSNPDSAQGLHEWQASAYFLSLFIYF